jgi:DNA polymerase-3 subunit alpha
MFGEVEEVSFPEPVIQTCEQWSNIEQLRYEKEVVGLYLSGHPLDTYKFEIENFCNVNLKALENLDAYANKDVNFAGIMTQVQHKVAKNGNPFGSFSLEDYDGNFQMALFKDDYGKYKHMMIEGAYVFITAKCEFNDWRKSFELKITGINFLSDVRANKIKSIQLYSRINDLSTNVIDSIFELVNENKGNCDLKLVILDDDMQGGVVEVTTKKFKVEPSNHFIDNLRKISGFNAKFGK